MFEVTVQPPSPSFCEKMILVHFLVLFSRVCTKIPVHSGKQLPLSFSKVFQAVCRFLDSWCVDQCWPAFCCKTMLEGVKKEADAAWNEARKVNLN